MVIQQAYDDDQDEFINQQHINVGSFPKDFQYGDGDDDFEDEIQNSIQPSKPSIILMGMRGSGKSSIKKVVFHKMSPNETLFLESTTKLQRDDINNSSFVQFEILDFPGQINVTDESTFDSEAIFSKCGALIFVIDAQDDYIQALSRLNETVIKAYKINKKIKFEVFIHKVDALSDDEKIERQRDMHQRANDELSYCNNENINLNFYLTSIYDHSIFEAFSKVVQRLIEQLPTLENLLNIFVSVRCLMRCRFLSHLLRNSGIEKAFLFDVVSKIYVATDNSPVDMQSYELCCDMIDIVIDISCIYGMKDNIESDTFDNESASIIKLNNSTILYLREVNRYLAVVCILREDSFEKQGIINYNFHIFRKGIKSVFDVENSMKTFITPSKPSSPLVALA